MDAPRISRLKYYVMANTWEAHLQTDEGPVNTREIYLNKGVILSILFESALASSF
jgi:hypothetical protein